MTLTECKQLMRRFQHDAEAGIVQFNWRTTARWSLRHRWEYEENGRLRDALQRMTERAEDRANEAAACHDIMAECRNIAGDPHASTIDAVRGLLARAEQAEAALAELRTEFALAQVALASANVTYTVNRGVGEALAMAEIGDDTFTCDECGGEGVIITCCDDICVGQGYCMHGDGESICPKCDGDGVLSNHYGEVQP